MENIYAIQDYRSFFGAKFNDNPYRSGMDKRLLKSFFQLNGFELIFISPSKIDFKSSFKNKIVIYTSSEDYGYFYKSYLEDIVLGLEIGGARVIPNYKYLRAVNNKVFMEILRDQIEYQEYKSIISKYFGSLEEFIEQRENIIYPIVIKSAEGALSRGVTLARNEREALAKIKQLSASKNLTKDLWEIGRKIKFNNYKIQSKHRKKFIVQNLVPNLSHDWKILVFGNKYYILKRNVRPNDFRASGSGILTSTKDIPQGILDFSQKLMMILNIPNASLDIAFDGISFQLIEFQSVYYGSYTLTFSKFYFEFKNNQWICVDGESILEEEYSNSISQFINSDCNYLAR